MMFLISLLFVIGFVSLVKGADYLIEGACALAKRVHIPNVVIGLTIVSIGTSAPELVVNIISSLKGESSIALGNVFGSNIANILLVLGIGALLKTIKLDYAKIRFDLLFSALGYLLFLFFIYNGTLARLEGSALLLFFTVYLFLTFKNRKEKPEDMIHELTVLRSVIFFISGMIMLYLGGKWVIDGVVYFAGYFNVSSSLLALTIVALGTSLPELTVTIIAISKNKFDIAVGNAIGSNIFNLLLVLGTSSLISPLKFDPIFFFELFTITTATAFLFIFIRMKHKLNSYQGIFFLITYITYLAFIFARH
jgi:cation:H+ antiporter